MESGCDGGDDVAGQHAFGRMMADSARGAKEEHSRRDERREDHGVVSRTTGHRVNGIARCLYTALQYSLQFRIAGHCSLIEKHRGVKTQFSSGADALRRVEKRINGLATR